MENDSDRHRVCSGERYSWKKFLRETVQMGVSKEQAVHNRERILAAAERLFREKGVDAVGLAELMKEAGFTQGGFYNHFTSKEELVEKVVDRAMDGGRQQFETEVAKSLRLGVDPLTRHIQWYLSKAQRDDIETGCAIAGFAGDIPHLSDAARGSYAEALSQAFDGFAQMILQEAPKLSQKEARARAVSLYSHLVGSLLLSRAVSGHEPALAQEILTQSQASLLARRPHVSAKISSSKSKGSTVSKVRNTRVVK